MFENIKILLKEGLVEGLDDSPPDFHPPKPPTLVRGVSLPNILDDSILEDESKTSFINNADNSLAQLLESSKIKKNVDTDTPHRYVSKSIWTENELIDSVEKQSVAVQVSADFTQINKEIAEGQSTSCQTDNEELNYCVYKAVNTAENITSTSTFKRELKNDVCDSKIKINSCNNETKQIDSSIEDLLSYEKLENKTDLKLEVAKQETLQETWSSTPPLLEIQKMPVIENLNNDVEKSYSDFRVNIEILQHEFGPLPPSPVEEVDDEYSDILQSVPTCRKSDSLTNDCMYRRNSRISVSGSIRSNRVPEIPPHRDQNSSLKTRSVDAGFTRNHRTQFMSSRKDVSLVNY